MAKVTATQSAEIHRLNAEGLGRTEIAQIIGVTPKQVDSVLAWIKIRARLGQSEEQDPENDELVEAIETTLGLERDLQRTLRERIEQLEPGLVITDEGKERTVPSGRIDITAKDRSGSAVVIELKAGEADRDAVGQILAYMGDLMSVEERVRGIVVASDFTPRAVAAARAAGKIELRQYRVTFSFPTIPLTSQR